MNVPYDPAVPHGMGYQEAKSPRCYPSTDGSSCSQVACAQQGPPAEPVYITLDEKILDEALKAIETAK